VPKKNEKKEKRKEERKEIYTGAKYTIRNSILSTL
jgi:hypothetical protein